MWHSHTVRLRACWGRSPASFPRLAAPSCALDTLLSVCERALASTGEAVFDRHMSATVDFWFDASCPWTWITSRWAVEVAEARGFAVTWHPFSLAVLNEGKDIPEDYRKHVEDARLGAQVAAGVAAECGNEILGAFYTELGERYFGAKRQNERTAIAEALEAAGAPADLLDRAADYADAIEKSTREGLKLVGDDVGVPIVAFDGVAFFGPVISPAPHGQAALDLWDGCVALARTPGFFELKRTRTVGPIFD